MGKIGKRMMLLFNTEFGEYVGRWVNVEYSSHDLPQKGDRVILHHGDYNEVSEEWEVVRRTYDGTKLDVVYVTVKQP